jgi:hypothetical protein
VASALFAQSTVVVVVYVAAVVAVCGDDVAKVMQERTSEEQLRKGTRLDTS